VRQYSRVTYGQRCQIFALMQTEITIPEMAKRLGFNKSTIYRELKRNISPKPNSLYKWEYDPLRAQALACDRKMKCRRPIKINSEIILEIKAMLEIRWSPQLIAGRLKRQGKCNLTHQTIYRFIKQNPVYERYLHFYGRRRFEYKRRKDLPRPGWWVSIEKRPDVCVRRERIGDWERDTLIGRKRKNALLVCTDRKSRFTKVAFIEKLNSEIISNKTMELIRETSRAALTLTNDNGSEFKAPNKLPIPVYYCHPGSPQERGTVENTIGIIRRFFPKKSDLLNINTTALENWLNHRPRKVLDYKTSHEVYYEKEVAMAT
jgi:transposase, IS30 family